MSTLLSRLRAREVRGARGHKQSSYLSKWYYPRIPDRLIIPIKSLICVSNAELRDTVLLGFLKDGKHLVGYTAREMEDEDDFSSGFLCTYTLSLWRFDDKTVFECYLFNTNEEPLAVSGFLNICVTELNEHNLLCVHGWQRGDGESSEHFVSLVSMHRWEWSEQSVATTKFEYQGISDYGWEVAYVPGGATPTLILNTGGSLAYHHIQISKSKESTKLKLENRVFFHLDKCVMWLMARNKAGRSNGVLDLDVRIVGVSDGSLFFNLSILYQNTTVESNPVPPSWLRRAAIFSLCPTTGLVDSRRLCVPVPLVPSTTALFDQMNISQSLSLRRWLNSLPCPALNRLTNTSALTGESLTYLYHPIYPLAIRGYTRTKNGTNLSAD